MVNNPLLSRFRIALMQRAEDAAMLAVVIGNDVRGEDLLLHLGPLVVQTGLVDLPVEGDEQRIARGERDQKMELAVKARKAVLVLQRGFRLLQHGFDLFEIAWGGVLDGEAGGVGLDRKARV